MSKEVWSAEKIFQHLSILAVIGAISYFIMSFAELTNGVNDINDRTLSLEIKMDAILADRMRRIEKRLENLEQ